MLNKALLYYDTIKYLKLIQIKGRIKRYFSIRISENSDLPELREFSKRISFCKKPVSTHDFDSFTFLSETKCLSLTGWNSSDVSKLWNYNLHYFDYIHSKRKWDEHQISTINSLINKWIDENPIGIGTGWDPYPLSIRIVNWVKWHLVVEPLSEKAILSLWNQLLWLAKRPEYHLLGNHILTNAKALMIGSVLFDDSKALKIHIQGTDIFKKELKEQFLSDGAHFERSVMYHALAMEDLLDLVEFNKLGFIDFPYQETISRIKKGLNWLFYMIHPNGDFPHFNDCTNGIAPGLDDLYKFSDDIGLKIDRPEKCDYFKHLKPSGFMVLFRKNMKLMADIGAPSPHYQPGHAHAEVFSFELSINGFRTIVNSGISEYASGANRLRERSTATHSTVEIDKENSSEVWSAFRMARRAKVYNIEMETQNDEEVIRFSASHDGYKRLSGKPIHNREWIVNDQTVEINDFISGEFQSAISRIYFHPEVSCKNFEKGIILKNDQIGIIILNAFSKGEEKTMKLKRSIYHPAFGVSLDNYHAEIEFSDPALVSLKVSRIAS